MWEDRRLWGTPRWYLERPKDWWMFLPSEFLRCVVFLEQDEGSGPVPRGTAFFVSMKADDLDGLHVYLVTASHCVWDWKRDEPRTDLSIRVDIDQFGKLGHVKVPDGDEWVFHPEPAPRVDIAVLPIGGSAGDALTKAGCRWIPRSMLFSEEMLLEKADEGIGLSDEVLALGLFSKHAGKVRNEPVIRTGNIAMMPREAVVTNPTMGPMEVYLVELRSIAGMSGSPVFAPHRFQYGAPTRATSLFGVLLGHYDTDTTDPATASVNMGIGMVAPAKMLGEILDEEGLVRRRKETEERARELAKDAGFKPDRATDQDDGLTREAFLEDLKKAARRTSTRERKN